MSEDLERDGERRSEVTAGGSPAEQLITLELGERAVGRWLTSSAAAMVAASILEVGVGIALLSSTDDGFAKVVMVLACVLAAGALALAVLGFLSGGKSGSAAERMQETLEDPAKGTELTLVALRARERHNGSRARYLRFGAAALLAAILVGAGGAAIGALGDDDDEDGSGGGDESAEARPDPGGPSDEQLAARFRPVLLFDSDEHWRPLDVDAFFAEGRHGGCRPKHKKCAALQGAAGLDAFPDGGFLEVNGERSVSRSGRYTGVESSCVKKALYDCDSGPRSRLYYNVTHRGGRAYIDYWWYLRFNDAPAGTRFDHQSDWEGVVVAVEEGPQPTFDWVAFAAHEGVWRYFREALRCEGSHQVGSCGSRTGARIGNRVNVYVARGTHAAYPYPCAGRTVARICGQNKRIAVPLIRFRIPENGFDGKEEWGADDEPTALRPFPAATWVRWPGHWDTRGMVKSPGRQARFAAPYAVRAADCPPKDCPSSIPAGYRAACFGWFGPNASAVACDPSSVRRRVPLGSATFSVRRAHVVGEQLVLDTDVTTSASSPGIAQLTGTYLGENEAILVEGPAPASTELYVRARWNEAVVEARFTDLGLENGGTAIVRQEPSAEHGLTLSVTRPDGSLASSQAPLTLSPPGS